MDSGSVLRGLGIISGIRESVSDAALFMKMPLVSINLMHSKTKDNDPFYGKLVVDFYRESNKRHRKLFFLKSFCFGVSVCKLPEDSEHYFRKMIEESAQRNYRKAQKAGYAFKRIDYNAYLGDIADIWRSKEVRQGRMPESLLKNEASPCPNPPSKRNFHDYPYFGVLKDGKLFAYAGGLLAGEVFSIDSIYGHGDRQKDGIMGMLMVDIVRYLRANYPNVKYMIYGTYFGGRLKMRRFKRKFGFMPCKVSWILD